MSQADQVSSEATQSRVVPTHRPHMFWRIALTILTVIVAAAGTMVVLALTSGVWEFEKVIIPSAVIGILFGSITYWIWGRFTRRSRIVFGSIVSVLFLGLVGLSWTAWQSIDTLSRGESDILPDPQYEAAYQEIQASVTTIDECPKYSWGKDIWYECIRKTMKTVADYATCQTQAQNIVANLHLDFDLRNWCAGQFAKVTKDRKYCNEIQNQDLSAKDCVLNLVQNLSINERILTCQELSDIQAREWCFSTLVEELVKKRTDQQTVCRAYPTDTNGYPKYVFEKYCK